MSDKQTEEGERERNRIASLYNVLHPFVEKKNKKKKPNKLGLYVNVITQVSVCSDQNLCLGFSHRLEVKVSHTFINPLFATLEKQFTPIDVIK